MRDRPPQGVRGNLIHMTFLAPQKVQDWHNEMKCRQVRKPALRGEGEASSRRGSSRNDIRGREIDVERRVGKPALRGEAVECRW